MYLQQDNKGYFAKILHPKKKQQKNENKKTKERMKCPKSFIHTERLYLYLWCRKAMGSLYFYGTF